MKGLKKIALASAIAAVSAGAQAELKALDDSAMGELTGQAGLTIDIETEWSIAEFMYKDAVSAADGGSNTDGGAILIQDISMGANDNATGSTMLDNIRLNIDVAGSVADGSNVLKRGLGDFYGADGFAALALSLGFDTSKDADSQMLGLAGGIEAKTGGSSLAQWEAAGTDMVSLMSGGLATAQKARAAIGDGDLVLHWTATDYLAGPDTVGAPLPVATATGGSSLAAAGGTWAANAGSFISSVDFDTIAYAATHSVDFGFKIGAIAIADSSYEAGDLIDGTTTSTVTTLISDLSINGFFGNQDIHIQNNGNGFNAEGEADSKIFWDNYYNITDLDVYIDIAGVALRDISIDNHRGDTTGLDGLSSFGYAHSMREIYAMQDNVLTGDATEIGTGNEYKDGIAINTITKFDMDIDHLSFGDTNQSIGQIFLTDVVNTTNWTISAH